MRRSIRSVPAMAMLWAVCGMPFEAVAECGDGEPKHPEGCDDGNTEDGDGCSSVCVVEACHVCEEYDIGGQVETCLTTAADCPWWTPTGGGQSVTVEPDTWSATNYGSHAGGLRSTDLHAIADFDWEFDFELGNTGDDYAELGLGFGYEDGDLDDPDADWILFKFKVYWNNDPGAGLYRLEGEMDPADVVWGNAEDGVTSLLSSSHSIETTWDEGDATSIRVRYRTDRIKIWIDGVLEINKAGTFPDGDITLYFYGDAFDSAFTLVSPYPESVCTALADDFDADGDGLTCWEEDALGTDDVQVDSDGDGLSDWSETTLSNTDPLDDDSDDDGLLDGFEDANANGVVDAGETDPNSADTDGDGLWDALELGFTERQAEDTVPGSFRIDFDPSTTTDPTRADTDGDGLTDGLEDSDGDGRVDEGEPDPNRADSDADGLLDGTEDANRNGQIDPGETSPALLDSDEDGLPDGLELGLSEPEDSSVNLDNWTADNDPSTTTDPTRKDTDGDGLSDAAEDANANGRVDAGETDPNLTDSDGDGVSDLDELRQVVGVPRLALRSDVYWNPFGCSSVASGPVSLWLLGLLGLVRRRRREG